MLFLKALYGDLPPTPPGSHQYDDYDGSRYDEPASPTIDPDTAESVVQQMQAMVDKLSSALLNGPQTGWIKYLTLFNTVLASVAIYWLLVTYVMRNETDEKIEKQTIEKMKKEIQWQVSEQIKKQVQVQTKQQAEVQTKEKSQSALAYIDQAMMGLNGVTRFSLLVDEVQKVRDDMGRMGDRIQTMSNNVLTLGVTLVEVKKKIESLLSLKGTVRDMVSHLLDLEIAIDVARDGASSTEASEAVVGTEEGSKSSEGNPKSSDEGSTSSGDSSMSEEWADGGEENVKNVKEFAGGSEENATSSKKIAGDGKETPTATSSQETAGGGEEATAES